MNKNTHVIWIFIVICLFFCGCDPYGGKYPKLDENEIWICDEEAIYFLGLDEGLGYPPAFIMTDNQMEKVRADFMSGGIFVLIKKDVKDGDRKKLLMGKCSFKKDSFTIKEVERDELFNLQYETLTFHLYYNDEVDWVDGWPVPKIEQSK